MHLFIPSLLKNERSSSHHYASCFFFSHIILYLVDLLVPVGRHHFKKLPAFHWIAGASFILGLPGVAQTEESACNAGDANRSLGQKDSLEKDMATLSSILVWKIQWMEEPGRLQSMGSQEVRHN